MSNENGETGFSREYVEKLRGEAAGYRTKLRELETAQATGSIEAELAKRGVKADPKWVEMGEGMSAHDAVENFVAQYPQLSTTQAPANSQLPIQETNFKEVPKVQSPANSNTNANSTPTGRSLDEIKKDPTARSQLRDRYRQMLQQGSRQRDLS